jgi:hypothetical protein
VPDFPKPGILFYDITGILVQPRAFRYCIDQMVKLYRKERIDASRRSSPAVSSLPRPSPSGWASR